MSLSEPNRSLVAEARALVPLIREHAAEGESQRRLPAALVKAFTGAGIFRMCRPRVLGGLEVDPVTVIHVVEEIARADGSAGWCAMISGAGSVFAGILPREGAEAIYADRDVVSGGSFAPAGRAVEVPGGYRVTGRWPFVSGADYSHWLGGTCVVFDGDKPKMGAFGPECVVPLCPIAECRIHDTWSVSGLRGTGSHDLELADVFVPRDRVALLPPPAPTYPGPLYAFPFFGFLALSVASVALGIARAAIDEIVSVARNKVPFGMMSKLATRPTAQLAVAEAETALRSSRAFLLEATSQAWASALAGRVVSPRERALLRLSATHVVERCARAVSAVYTEGGASALYAKSPLQRCMRDIHAITQHATVAAPTHELFGKILLEVEPDAPLL